MIAESNEIEATPLSQATASKTDWFDSSALLADGKLLGSVSDMLVGSTHVDSSGTTVEMLDRLYWTGTATIGEAHRRRYKRARPLHSIEPSVEDHFDRANSERIELLAREYVAKDKFSREEQDRLAIVTERVRQLLPAVTVAEFEALEKNLQASRQISTLLDNLRARLTQLSGKRG